MQSGMRCTRALALLGASASGWAVAVDMSTPLLTRLTAGATRHPADWVAALAGAAVLASATWLLLLLIVELTAALAFPGLPRRLPAPAGIATLVALTLGSSAPSAADERHLLPPDRAESPHGAHVVARPDALLVVRRGDSLWRLAARRLVPPTASDAVVHGAVTDLYEANRRVIGPDPDHIHPGTRLRVPPRGEDQS